MCDTAWEQMPRATGSEAFAHRLKTNSMQCARLWHIRQLPPPPCPPIAHVARIPPPCRANACVWTRRVHDRASNRRIDQVMRHQTLRPQTRMRVLDALIVLWVDLWMDVLIGENGNVLKDLYEF